MIGVIADDLTGAAEIAGIGLRHGLSAEVVWEGPLENKADLICFDTDSRSLPAGEAGAKAAMAAGWLGEAGAKWIYKKVDSVLRGPVLAELQAVQGRLGLSQTLLVPANPSRNRVITGGNYFVNGSPIHQSEFARDPEYPRTNPSVLALLGAAAAGHVRVCEVGVLPELAGVLVGEAATPADLARWAGCFTPKLLVAGGGEFFAAMLAAQGHRHISTAHSPVIGDANEPERGRPRPLGMAEGGEANPTRQQPIRAKRAGTPALRFDAAPAADGPELFVCGSVSESCRQFVRSSVLSGIPVFSLPEQLLAKPCLTPALTQQLSSEIVAAGASHRRVVLEIGLPVVQDRSLGRKLTLCLAELAATVLRSGRVRRVYTEGGATAVELARLMGWRSLTAVREVAPGVVMSVVGRDGIQFTVKPGSYLWPASVQKPLAG